MIKNLGNQQCLAGTSDSRPGAPTTQDCDRLEIDQDWIPFTEYGGGSQIYSLWGYGEGGVPICLSANFNNDVYTTPCSTGDRDHHVWQQVGMTLRNKGTGRCLSASLDHQVHTAVCNSTVPDHNWEFQLQ